MYLKVIGDILEYYFKYLNMEELFQLKIIPNTIKSEKDVTDDMVVILNSVLNKIWNKTLSNINEFKNGEKFCFLIRYTTIPDDILRKIGFGSARFKLLTEDNIEECNLGEEFLIVIPQYEGSIRNTPVLPMDFNTIRSCEKLNYKVLAVTFFDDKLANLSDLADDALKFSEKNNVPVLNIDKLLYMKNKGQVVLNWQEVRNVAFILYHRYGGNIRNVKRNSKFVDNKKVRNTIIKYYDGKISLEKLDKEINKIFDEITNSLDSLDNNGKKRL